MKCQVYGSETIPRGVTMVELHNNFTAKGAKKTDDGTLPTNHAWHETIEVTHGFNDWFETGFYLFMSARNGNGWDFVGTHIRPRIRVPPKLKWLVGVSLSQEHRLGPPAIFRRSVELGNSSDHR